MEFKAIRYKSSIFKCWVDLNETIYVKIPKWDKNYNKNQVWSLKKALYGLKQALYEEITNYLNSFGFKQYKSDKFLYGKYNKD